MKWGPYYYNANITTDSTTGKKHATITIYAYEATGSRTDWTLDPTSAFYDEFFPLLPSTITTTNMDIDLNDADVTWTVGSIVFADIALNAGYNDFEFWWTPYTAPTTPTDDDESWIYATAFLFPNWLWVSGLLVLLGVGCWYSYYYTDLFGKKKKK